MLVNIDFFSCGLFGELSMQDSLVTNPDISLVSPDFGLAKD